MPELPDLTVVADALHAALAGRPITPGRARAARRPRDAGRARGRSSARRVDGIRRRGKFLLIDLDRDRVAVNPMLTGRFQLAATPGQAPAKTAVVLGFGPRTRGPRGTPAAVDARRRWLPGRRRPAEVRYQDPTQMGKVYLRPAG